MWPGNYGDEVNPFGNGFDVYQQRAAYNTMIVGWTATKADPATHFFREQGTLAGAVRFEYAPHGMAAGLCVSDPGYYAAGTGLKDGLVLRSTNTGPWQQWSPKADGTLRNAATGLVVSTNGPGAQLRGTASSLGLASLANMSQELTGPHAPYMLIVYVLTEKITSGELKPGDRLPSVTELVKTYDVSHSTARRALAKLKDMGLTDTVPGYATFVRFPDQGSA